MKLRDQLAKDLHEARMKLCWGKSPPKNKLWPSTAEELRKRLHHGDPLLDQAYAQADAIINKYRIKT